MKFRLLLLAFVTLSSGEAIAHPPAEPQFRRFFEYYVDKRSVTERALNSVGLSGNDVGRSFAVIVSVYKYDSRSIGDLPPAETDYRKLLAYLRDVEFFDEIVVLKNHDFTEDNLKYFLQAYFPRRVSAFPRSRFLFAFTGHGFNDEDNSGFLLQSNATGWSDRYRSVHMASLRLQLQQVARSGYHVLALVNACYGGNLVTPSFGGPERAPPNVRYIPLPGAHALTAGGTREPVFAAEKGGSLFFETIFAALEGHADQLPEGKDRATGITIRGDGIVSFNELASYVSETIKFVSRGSVNPLAGTINPLDGRQRNNGGFFFFSKNRPAVRPEPPPRSPTPPRRFGPDSDSSEEEKPRPPRAGPEELDRPENRSQPGIHSAPPPNQFEFVGTVTVGGAVGQCRRVDAGLGSNYAVYPASVLNQVSAGTRISFRAEISKKAICGDGIVVFENVRPLTR